MSASRAHSLRETDFAGSVPGRYWHEIDDGRLQCDICPRFCKLRDGQRGLCFVRARHNDEIVLTTYGRSSGFCVDPIEKKPLDHFLPGTPVLSFGTAGCNLACKFCQNWDISKSREFDRLQDSASPEMIAEAAIETGCRSVAFTYNDPVIFLEYAIDVAEACHTRGLKTVAVTAGYMTEEPRVEFYQHMDAANVDLKAFTDRFYWKVCGGRLEPVLETIKYLKEETDVWFELTNLLIPGENDSETEIEEMTQWIMENLGPDVPLHVTAFHPDWKMMKATFTTSKAKARIATIAKRYSSAATGMSCRRGTYPLMITRASVRDAAPKSLASSMVRRVSGAPDDYRYESTPCRQDYSTAQLVSISPIRASDSSCTRTHPESLSTSRK
jgi:pyruvate formate lyase activating enzyme